MSNSSLKQIVISPELFKIKNNKTRKAGQKTAPVPIINPNVVKNKLLTRIKEHKKAEHSINPNKPNNANSSGSQIKNPNGRINKSRFNPNVITPGPKTSKDEFNDSLNYFSQLKQNDVIEKNNNIMQRKTVKRYPDASQLASQPIVNLELPAELQNIAPFVPPPPPVSSLPINIKYNVDQTVPYGCLKGGIKPTYKNLYTRRMMPGEHATVTMQPQSPQNDLARQQKLAELQQRMKQKPALSAPLPPAPLPPLPPAPLPPAPLPPLPPAPLPPAPLPSVPLPSVPLPSVPLPPHTVETHNPIPPSPPNTNENALPESLMDLFPELNNGTNAVNEKRLEKFKKEEKMKKVLNEVANADPITIEDILPPNKKRQKVQKTIKRRYTVGRNLKTNTVGVLIKDNYTRKMVMNAHKEMKKKTIHELKKELRGHNLIKAGCSAPNDVLRTIYEHSKLAGDIVNTNADMLMHNFVNAEQT
jgi:hypothetical protein